jgi:hypothetical protein
MQTDRTFVATFHGATRRKNTVYGNPQWTLHTSNGDYQVTPDASLGGVVSNYLEDATDSLVGREVKFTTHGGRGGVWKMERI